MTAEGGSSTVARRRPDLPMWDVHGDMSEPLPEPRTRAREAILVAYVRDRMAAGFSVQLATGADGGDALELESTPATDGSAGRAYVMTRSRGGTIVHKAETTPEAARYLVRCMIRKRAWVQTDPPIGNGREAVLDKELSDTDNLPG